MIDNPYLLLILIGIVLIAIYKYLYRNLNYWKKHNIRGPKPIPIYGNLFCYFYRPTPEVELDWYRKYGKIYGYYNGNNPIINVAKPDLLKQIMVKHFNTFRNHKNNSILVHPVIPKLMTFTRDDEWKKTRAISSPAFTSGKLKKMYSSINDCCNDFINNLDEYAKNSREIELKGLNNAYTMDVIAKCAFATNTNSLKNPDNSFIKNANAFFNRNKFKILALVMLPSFISKNGTFLRILDINYSCLQFFVEVGQQLIGQRKNRKEKHNDFLQLLMDVERNEEEYPQTDNMEMNHLNEGNDEITAKAKAFSNVVEKKLTEDEIVSQCVMFFIAGFETTATTLAFCTYEMCLNPSIQQKLYEEVREAFGDNEDVDYETLLKLPYLDAVISETLRKYPPVLKLDRQAMNDFPLDDTGFVIPKGMIVEIPVYAIHNDPVNFENPSLFNPERFIPENRSNIKPYTYLPFGTGPRNCIGIRFALLEAKLALVNISRKFIFFKTAKTDIPIKFTKGRVAIISTKKIIVGIKRRH